MLSSTFFFVGGGAMLVRFPAQPDAGGLGGGPGRGLARFALGTAILKEGGYGQGMEGEGGEVSRGGVEEEIGCLGVSVGWVGVGVGCLGVWVGICAWWLGVVGLVGRAVLDKGRTIQLPGLEIFLTRSFLSSQRASHETPKLHFRKPDR